MKYTFIMINLLGFFGFSLNADDLKVNIDFFNASDLQYIENNLNKYKAKCETRDAKSCGIISSFYQRNYELSKFSNAESEQLSLDFALKGCDLRDARSCFNASLAYQRIDGYPSNLSKDESKALDFAKKACEYKMPVACYVSGNLFAKQAKDATNPKQKREFETAKRVYQKKACDLGYKIGC